MIEVSVDSLAALATRYEDLLRENEGLRMDYVQTAALRRENSALRAEIENFRSARFHERGIPVAVKWWNLGIESKKLSPKIHAIKGIREELNCGLREAKDLLEEAVPEARNPGSFP